MVTEEDIVKALRGCYDPEIPVNVMDLGLVYDIAIEGDKVKVKMTLTAPGCPMHTAIREDALRKIKAVAGVKEADVEIVWDPPWSRDMISEEGKRILGLK